MVGDREHFSFDADVVLVYVGNEEGRADTVQARDRHLANRVIRRMWKDESRRRGQSVPITVAA